MPQTWGLLTVIRASPPAYGVCREATCKRNIEWVTTTTGKKLPVDLPLEINRVYERNDGTFVTVIRDSAVHWNRCKEKR